MTIDQLKASLALMGWEPAYNVMNYYLYHADSRKAVVTKGVGNPETGTFDTLDNCDPPEVPVEWAKLPSQYDRMVMFTTIKMRKVMEP